MRRNDESGQALVFAVVFLVVLLGMAAAVLDVGSWYRAHRELQATADAAALAGAQALPESTSDASALASEYAQKNGGLSPDEISFSSDVVSDDTIKVHLSRPAPGFFAKVFGIDSVTVGGKATARTGNPAQALYVAPMVVSERHPKLKCKPLPCFGETTSLPYEPMGAPGGFGMLNLDGESGTVGTSNEAAWISKGFEKYLPLGLYQSDPGAKFSSSLLQGALSRRIDSVLLFPVFRTLTGGGQNAEYDIIGWVGFYLTGFTVQGNIATLNGYFTRFIATGIQSKSAGQRNFGVRSITLVG